MMIQRYTECINDSLYHRVMPAFAVANGPTPPTDTSVDVNAMLDAALAVFSSLGLRRATIDDIAKQAGVGRVTIYRRIGGKQDLVDAVLAREMQRLLTDVIAAAEAADSPTERIAASFATTMTALRDNAVWQRMLALETDSALQQLTLGGQSMLVAAVAATVHILWPELGDAAPSAFQLARAELMVRITHSVLLTPHAVVPLGDYAELLAFARAHLVPIATAGT